MADTSVSPALIAALSGSNPQGYSDLLVKQQQLARNRAMAQALMQQTMSPDMGTQEVSGRVVPYTMGQGLTRLAQAYLTGQMNQKNDQQAADIGVQQGQMYSNAMANALAKLQGAVGGQSPTPTPPTQANDGLPNSTPSNAPAPVQVTNSSSAPPASSGGSPLVAGANTTGLPSRMLSVAADPTVNAMFPQIAAKFGEGAVTASLPTTEQKNANDPLIGASTVSNLQTQNMTPLQKLQLARGLAIDGSPQAAQLDAAIQKENYVAPVSVGQGDLSINPLTRSPIAYNPKTAPGIAPTFITSGGVTSPTGAQALGGYSSANAGIEGAEQRAKQANTIFTVPTATGQNTNWGGNLAGGGASGPMPPQATSAPTGMPSPAPASAQGPIQSRVQSGTTGPSVTDNQINEAAGKSFAALPQNVVQAKQASAGLESALSALDNTSTGPGTSKAFSLAATLQNMGLPVAKTPTENYQTLTKFLNNALSLSAGVNGNTGSDSRFDQFMHGQPSADLMNKGPLRGAINYVLSQIDAVPAGAQVMQNAYQAAKAAGDPNPAFTAQKAWSDAYDPRVFQFNRMSPDEKAAFKSQMMRSDPSGAAAKAFGQKYNQFHANNWVQ
ncbi:hypothetical protein [Rhodoferax sp. GW822-FHT02A01]|uniref:hypothetical protein n=1 Tax=Rhodoferax sp. GW822-FHT02A01 TaxID=3141537 RepID=UPI00315D151D